MAQRRRHGQVASWSPAAVSVQCLHGQAASWSPDGVFDQRWRHDSIALRVLIWIFQTSFAARGFAIFRCFFCCFCCKAVAARVKRETLPQLRISTSRTRRYMEMTEMLRGWEEGELARSHDSSRELESYVFSI